MQIDVYLNKDAQDRIPKTVFLVEANDFAQRQLWEEWAIGGNFKNHFPITRKRWEDRPVIGLQGVGRMDNFPVVVKLFFHEIDGFCVCFYDACSVVVNHNMVEDWLIKTFPGVRKTDANNFGSVMSYLEKLTEDHQDDLDYIPNVDIVVTEVTNRPQFISWIRQDQPHFKVIDIDRLIRNLPWNYDNDVDFHSAQRLKTEIELHGAHVELEKTNG